MTERTEIVLSFVAGLVAGAVFLGVLWVAGWAVTRILAGGVCS